MRYQFVLFDLDGTLIDSREVLGKAAAYSLRECGAEHLITPELLHRFFGAPLHEAYTQFCGMTDEESKRAIAAFETYYLTQGLYGGVLFDGMEDVLNTLRGAGLRLALATNGAQANAERILEHAGIAKYFTVISGLTALGSDETKTDVIRRALERLGVEDRSRAIMVGDRCYDIEAAKACGLDTIGAAYGYGGGEELSACQPTDMAPTVQSLLTLLMF